MFGGCFSQFTLFADVLDKPISQVACFCSTKSTSALVKSPCSKKNDSKTTQGIVGFIMVDADACIFFRYSDFQPTMIQFRMHHYHSIASRIETIL